MFLLNEYALSLEWYNDLGCAPNRKACIEISSGIKSTMSDKDKETQMKERGNDDRK